MKIAALLTIIYFYVTFSVQKKVNVTLNFYSTIHARVRRRRWKPIVFPAMEREERNGEGCLERTERNGIFIGIRTRAIERFAVCIVTVRRTIFFEEVSKL